MVFSAEKIRRQLRFSEIRHRRKLNILSFSNVNKQMPAVFPATDVIDLNNDSFSVFLRPGTGKIDPQISRTLVNI